MLFIGIYLLYLPRVKNIELWGDEIGVILFAESQFNQIVQLVSHAHASVPPLDYWNLAIWIKSTSVLLGFVSPEIYYRIPYMIIHAVSSIIFGSLLASYYKNTSSYKHKDTFYTIVAFLGVVTYFFNPILFLYSIEVRFYSLICLGELITVYLFYKGKLFHPLSIPLQLLFCLNSVFHFIILLPFIFIGIFRSKLKDLNIIFFIINIIVLAVLIFPLLLVPDAISQVQSVQLIHRAIQMFYTEQITHWLQAVVISIIIIIGILLKKRRNLIVLLGISSFYFITSISITFIKGYFDFYFRHFIHVIPFLLLIIFLIPTAVSHVKYRLLLFLTLLLFITIPFVVKTSHNILNGRIMSKGLSGIKKIYTLARENRKSIIFSPHINSQLSISEYKFMKFSFDWYARFYPTIPVYYPVNEEDACMLFSSKRNAILYNPAGKASCEHQVYTYSTFYSGTLIEHLPNTNEPLK